MYVLPWIVNAGGALTIAGLDGAPPVLEVDGACVIVGAWPVRATLKVVEGPATMTLLPLNEYDVTDKTNGVPPGNKVCEPRTTFGTNVGIATTLFGNVIGEPATAVGRA